MFHNGKTKAWSAFSADEKLGLVYVPLSAPNNDYYGGARPGAQEKRDGCVEAVDALPPTRVRVPTEGAGAAMDVDLGMRDAVLLHQPGRQPCRAVEGGGDLGHGALFHLVGDEDGVASLLRGAKLFQHAAGEGDVADLAAGEPDADERGPEAAVELIIERHENRQQRDLRVTEQVLQEAHAHQGVEPDVRRGAVQARDLLPPQLPPLLPQLLPTMLSRQPRRLNRLLNRRVGDEAAISGVAFNRQLPPKS